MLDVLLILHTVLTAFLSWRESDVGDGILNPDFETGDLRGWIKAGNAFDHQPTLGDNPKARNRESSNHQGRWWIGGYERYQGKPGQKPGDIQGDEPVGTLTSIPFIIRGDRISFLIGGGNHPWVEPDGRGSTCVNLLIDGKVVRTATGNNYETMRRHVWDVSKFKGKKAVIQLVDGNKGGWGHINFDDLRQMTRWQAEKGDFLIYLGMELLMILYLL
ncbi:TPA: hypothetical protein EYP37_02320 [Candidatus Poribacteria bacterium]|nr:hypothetical protein [Candidatus Poribacteria bacterium]